MRLNLKKLLRSILSILFATAFVWALFILNPSWSYAHETEFEHATVFHNDELSTNASKIISDAIARIQQSGIWETDTRIDLCLNDDDIYPSLHPFAGSPLAYAMFDKTVVKNCDIDFDTNLAETRWVINDYEHRKFNLTWLLAHEFTHNLQYRRDKSYFLSSTLNKLNWKLEGHADYVSRQMKDKDLRALVETCLQEDRKLHNGLPVFSTDDGTAQILLYFRHACVVKFLLEEKGMGYDELCESELDFEELYQELTTEWRDEEALSTRKD